MPGIRDLIPQPPWEGPPVPRSATRTEIEKFEELMIHIGDNSGSYGEAYSRTLAIRKELDQALVRVNTSHRRVLELSAVIRYLYTPFLGTGNREAVLARVKPVKARVVGIGKFYMPALTLLDSIDKIEAKVKSYRVMEAKKDVIGLLDSMASYLSTTEQVEGTYGEEQKIADSYIRFFQSKMLGRRTEEEEGPPVPPIYVVPTEPPPPPDITYTGVPLPFVRRTARRTVRRIPRVPQW